MAEGNIFSRLFRKRTPIPTDRKVFNIGIQERDNSFFLSIPLLYHIANSSVICRTCTTQLKNEIFRRGFTFNKKFTMKCRQCDKEFEQQVGECAKCGSIEFDVPDEEQLKYAKKLLTGYVNGANQMFVDVLRELEDDLNIIDDAYIVLVKEYFCDSKGNIKLHRIKEVFRGDPASMTIYADEVGERGQKGFIDIQNRDFISENAYDTHPESGNILHPVHYVNRATGEEEYFIEGEVLHFSKYAPSRLYGSSPVMTLFSHLTTLIAMENYVNASYTKSRMPRGILAVQTRNMDSMRQFWRSVKEKMESDPHFIPVMGIEAEGKGAVEWVKFMDSLKEMDYVAVKEDLRDRVAAFYGVSKIFMADNTASGGLNNEGMQILVTNRAVEMAQNVYNHYVFPWLMEEFGVTDWELVLPPSEEEDEIASLRKREIEIGLASQMQGLGFEVDLDEENNFVYTKPPPAPEMKMEDEMMLGNTAMGGPPMEEVPMDEQVEEVEETPTDTPDARMSVGPPQRFSGLPEEAANNNVDRRTERRVG